MSDSVWIGTCELSAQNEMVPFWEGGFARVYVEMMLRAKDVKTFETAVRAAVQTGGAKLEKLSQVSVFNRGTATTAQIRALDFVTFERPIMVSSPTPLDAPSSSKREEWTWETLQLKNDVWVLLDGTQWPNLPQMLKTSRVPHACLYTTTDTAKLASAPWIAKLTPGCDFYEALKSCSCDMHFGIFLRSNEDMATLRLHLRRYTMVRTPAGDESLQYFRFYDPRVMIDLLEGVGAARLGQFVAPFREVIVPLSQECILDVDVDVDAENLPSLIDVFDEAAAYQGRLIAYDITAEGSDQTFHIDSAVFAILGERMIRRTIYVLARDLARRTGPNPNYTRCLEVALAAPETAAQFGLSTVEQVTIFARCQLKFGNDFYKRQLSAKRVLQNPTLLPWQKKDKLTTWFANSIRDEILNMQTVA